MVIGQFIMKFLNKIKAKCPATKFADERIDKVQERIIDPIDYIFILNTIINVL